LNKTNNRSHDLIRLWVVLLSAVIGFLWFATEGVAQPAIDPMELLLSTKESYTHIGGYTVTLIRDEAGDGKPETISIKFRKPFEVYMKWVKSPNLGRELLYVEGQNDDKVIVKMTGFIGILFSVIRITPEETQRKGQHGIKDVGVGNMIDRIIEQTRIAQSNGDAVLYYHGIKEVNGRQVHEVERILPQKSYYPVHRLVVYIDQTLNLPVEIFGYDWNDKMVEHYHYTELNIQAKLEDSDFKTSNREYKVE